MLNPIAAGIRASPKAAIATDPAKIKGAINPNPAAASASKGNAIENAIRAFVSNPSSKLKANAAGTKANPITNKAAAPCITWDPNLPIIAAVAPNIANAAENAIIWQSRTNYHQAIPNMAKTHNCIELDACPIALKLSAPIAVQVSELVERVLD